MLLVVGLPAFLIELTVGQYARVGANKVFGRMVPAFKGLGYGMLLVRFYVNIYYVIVCAWAFFYLFVGFASNLPWENCGDHNTNTIAPPPHHHCLTTPVQTREISPQTNTVSRGYREAGNIQERVSEVTFLRENR